ncbi:serine/threonine-protein kinase Nek11-like [Rhopilema esculentum]|uniref:serine/threonine-protein kinase Nek11-like n=1 Tax=Rhopilema esculentum TaxID=499914 RepID=UPI0031E10591
MPQTNGAKNQDGKERILANRYNVCRKLGSGNFGTVFVVEDLKGDEKWKVLKEIPIGDLQPDETVDAVREARLLSKLDHPGIVKFYDSFIDGTHFCIVTEFCEDGDLDIKINERRKMAKLFDESRIVTWFIQLLLAVQYMHERRILHRDLKTRNIFLRNNMIKLGDFGISRILMGTTDIATTFTGTPYYMSPEVLKHEGYNSKSDIWSLGVILYELCSLRRAFDGQNLMGVMFKIVQNDPPSLAKYSSEELCRIYASMLNKDPKKRPSASELLKSQFLVRHLEKLKTKMNERARNEKSADKESKAIAAFLSESAKKGDIEGVRASKPPPKNAGELRPMTPGERLKQRKQEKADAEARKLSQVTAASYRESRQRYSELKNKQTTVNAAIEWTEQKGTFSEPRTELYSTDDIFSPSNHSLDEDDSGRDTLDFTTVSDVPEDEELANTYYSLVDDFEDDGSSLSESDSDDEYDDLMERMNDALELKDTLNETSPEKDDLGESLGDSSIMRSKKIESLRSECIRLLGKEGFLRSYDYLNKVRFESEESLLSEESIMDGLRNLVDKPRDCFLVDQLLFLEKQEEILRQSR